MLNETFWVIFKHCVPGLSPILTKKQRKIKRKRKKLLAGREEKKNEEQENGEQQELQAEWLHFLQEPSSNISSYQKLQSSAWEDRGLLNNSERRQAKLRYELHSSQQIRGTGISCKRRPKRESFSILSTESWTAFANYSSSSTTLSSSHTAPHFPTACTVLENHKKSLI